MRFNGLDLNLLVALDAVLTERNITKAAKRVFLSQPAMSNALARLRAYFDDDLVMVSGRQLLLTPRAEALVEPVREVLMRIDSTIAAPTLFEPRTAVRAFTLLVSDFTTAVLIPPLIAHIYAEAPGVTLTLQALQDDPAGLLAQGGPDLLVMPSQYVSAAHPSATIFSETYVCVTWESNARIRDALSFDDYLAAGHVAAQYTAAQVPAFDAWFLQRYGITRRLEVTTPSLAALPAMVVGTERIATVHKRLAEREAGRLPIRIWPAPIEIPALLQVMQWHAYRDKDPASCWLRQCVAEVAAGI